MYGTILFSISRTPLDVLAYPRLKSTGLEGMRYFTNQSTVIWKSFRSRTIRSLSPCYNPYQDSGEFRSCSSAYCLGTTPTTDADGISGTYETLRADNNACTCTRDIGIDASVSTLRRHYSHVLKILNGTHELISFPQQPTTLPDPELHETSPQYGALFVRDPFNIILASTTVSSQYSLCIWFCKIETFS